jgi:hypothetical protein
MRADNKKTRAAKASSLRELIRELRANADVQRAASLAWFFKTETGQGEGDP